MMLKALTLLSLACFALSDPVFKGTQVLAIDGGYPNLLYSLTSDNPNTPQSSKRIDGLIGSEVQLMAIAQQRTNGLIWGLSNYNDLYQVDPLTAKAYLVGRISGCNPIYSNPTLHMSFDPQSGALDIITLINEGGGNHFIVEIETGKCTSGAAIQSLNSSSPIHPAGGAYDAKNDRFYLIDSIPNNELTILNRDTNQLTLVGDLGIQVSGVGGFDVIYDSTSEKAYGFAALYTMTNETKQSDLYSIDLDTGVASKISDLDFSTNLYSFAAVDPASIKTSPYTFTLGDTRSHFPGKSSTSSTSTSEVSSSTSSSSTSIADDRTSQPQVPVTTTSDSSSSFGRISFFCIAAVSALFL